MVKKNTYAKRAAYLEIPLTGKETVKELQALIQKEMELLDTWDGSYFTDKEPESPEAPDEPVAPPEEAAEEPEAAEPEAPDTSKEGKEAILNSINYFIAIEDFEGALDLTDRALDLWDKDTALVTIQKRLTTQILERQEKRSIYEREQHQLKLENKSKRGRKPKKVTTNSDCIDAINAAIVKLQLMEKYANSQGKASQRYRSTAAQLRRIIKNNLRE